MKKIILILAAAFVMILPVSAEYVKPETAAKFAQDILGMKSLPSPDNTKALRASGRDGNTDPEFYVFNNPEGGWVIIAADDRVNPVIGYSNGGSFSTSQMPENVRWWMEGVAETVNAVRESDSEASAAVRRAWRTLPLGAPASEKDSLETANWSQDDPYNEQCPVANGENSRSLTGCVATAMAIVMRYNQWPAHGNGVIGGYITRMYPTYIPAYDIQGHVYDWDNMPLTNGGHPAIKWTSENRNEVAQLIHDCGVAVEMDFSSMGSSASSGKMLKAIKENMMYSDKAVLVSRSSYSLDEWFSLMKNEIANDRVVFYAGNGESGGHAFVIDGYDTEGKKLRINWGWGGYYNGYYSLDLTDSAKDINFPDLQEAIIGLAPDTASVQMTETSRIICISYNDFYGIEPLVPADLTIGSEFNFYVGWLSSNLPYDVEQEFKICLEDKDGNVKQEGWYMEMDLPASNGYLYANVTEKTALSVTPQITDLFRLYYKDEQDQWKPMQGNYDILPDVEGIVCGVIQDPVIVLPDDCAAGKDIQLNLSLGFTHVKSVTWSLNGVELETNGCKLVQGKNDIRADVEYLDNSKGFIVRTLELE